MKHPVDMVDHDVIEKLQSMQASLQIQYYVLDLCWKIWDAAEHSVYRTALGRGRCEGFWVGVIVSAIVVYSAFGGG